MLFYKEKANFQILSFSVQPLNFFNIHLLIFKPVCSIDI